MDIESRDLLTVFLVWLILTLATSCSKPDGPYYDKEEYCECTEVYGTHEYSYEGKCRKESELDYGFIEFKYRCYEN